MLACNAAMLAPRQNHCTLFFSVCGGLAGFCVYIVDDFRRGPPSKAMIAADTHALFDLKRPAGLHHLLPFLQAGQHHGPRSVNAGRSPTDQT